MLNLPLVKVLRRRFGEVTVRHEGRIATDQNAGEVYLVRCPGCGDPAMVSYEFDADHPSYCYCPRGCDLVRHLMPLLPLAFRSFKRQAVILHAAKSALPRALTLLGVWLPGGHLSGVEYLACNPRRNDHTPGSFKVNISNGKWADFASDGREGTAAGVDLVSLLAYLANIHREEAARRILDDDLPAIQAVATTAPVPVVEDIYRGPDGIWCMSASTCVGDRMLFACSPMHYPAQASMDTTSPAWLQRWADVTPQLKFHSRPDALWCYRSADGRPLMIVTRYNRNDGGKIVTAWTCWEWRDGSRREEWRCRAFPAERPLYGLDRLAGNPHAVVVITEGEKCADMVTQRIAGVVAVTWSGGASSVAKTNWKPLAGRRVIIWPDADAAGLSAADTLCGLLRSAGVEQIRRVDLRDIERHRGKGPLPAGFDVADLVTEGAEAALVSELLVGAQVV